MSVRTSRGAASNCKNCGGIGQVFKVDRGEYMPCPCTAGITLQAEPAPASASPPTDPESCPECGATEGCDRAFMPGHCPMGRVHSSPMVTFACGACGKQIETGCYCNEECANADQ